jgi:hypothetical protein
MLQLTAADLFNEAAENGFFFFAVSLSRSIHFHFIAKKKAPSQLNSSPDCFRLAQLHSSRGL